MARDKGGRNLKGKKWVVTNFIVEVAVEYPKSSSIEEAMEDAAEFMRAISKSSGRVHDSFCSITRVDEVGHKRPVDAPVIINEYPGGMPPEELPARKQNKKRIKKASRL